MRTYDGGLKKVKEERFGDDESWEKVITFYHPGWSKHAIWEWVTENYNSFYEGPGLPFQNPPLVRIADKNVMVILSGGWDV